MQKALIFASACALALGGRRGRQEYAAPYYNPSSTQEVLDNHYNAFLEGVAAASAGNEIALKEAVAKIYLDYGQFSAMRIYNDFDGEGGVLSRYELYEFYEQIFRLLKGCTDKQSDMHWDAPVATVNEGENGTHGVMYNTAFWTWRCPLANFFYATATFFFDGYKIRHQDMVVTWKPNVAVTVQNEKPLANVLSATNTFLFDGYSRSQHMVAPVPIKETQKGSMEVEPVNTKCRGMEGQEKRWCNHLNSFKYRNLEAIKRDYTDDSVIETYEWSTGEYKKYTGVEQISGMFKKMFEVYTHPLNFNVLLALDDHWNQVGWLVWNAPADTLQKVAETFLFDTKFKIRRHTIVFTRYRTGSECEKWFEQGIVDDRCKLCYQMRRKLSKVC